LLNETALWGHGAIIDASSTAAYNHIDDALFMSTPGGPDGFVIANTQMEDTSSCMNSWGMVIGEQQADGAVDKYVGYYPRRNPARLCIPDDRASDLYDALEWLTAFPLVKISLLESIVGVWLWCALLNRDLLAIPCSIFDMMRKNRGREILWWPSARAEATCMRFVIVLMYADVGAPLLPLLFSTDAMGANEAYGDHGGYGLCVRPITEAQGRHVFVHGGRVARTVVALDNKYAALKFPERRLLATRPYAIIDDDITDEREWTGIAHGRWAFSDHITLGEGRSVLKLLDALLMWPQAHRSKVISLQDNMGIAGSFHKGRSPAPALNYLLRRRTARTIAGAWRLILPWVETVRQVADHLSRLVH
jgi:hypothetical protein